MFAYGPELYELQSWGTAGDGDFHLDSHAQAANLLSHKLACMHSGVGPDAPSPNRLASPTGSATLHSPMPLPSRSRSCSKTPSHGTKMVRSQSHSASSTSSQTVKLKPPAGSGGDDSNGSESTCQDGSKTDEEDGVSSGGEAPKDREGQDGGSSDVESSSGAEIANVAEPEEDHDEETEGTSCETEESDFESSSSSLESDVEIPAQAAPLGKETKGGTSMKETKTGNPNSSQMPSLPKVDKWRSSKFSDPRMPSSWTRTSTSGVIK